MHRDTFNADFYVVAATIIPVLYLALTLQGQTYERLMNHMTKRHGKREYIFSWRFWGRVPLSSVLILWSYAILVAGIAGEWQALEALYDRSASHDTANVVNLALFVLLIAIVAGPFLRLWAATGPQPNADGELENWATEQTTEDISDDPKLPPE